MLSLNLLSTPNTAYGAAAAVARLVPSNKTEGATSCCFVPSSKRKFSDVVVSSLDNLPPTTDTNARADEVLVSTDALVNLIASPTLYPVPPLSTRTSLILPEDISEISALALPLPALESKVIISPLS